MKDYGIRITNLEVTEYNAFNPHQAIEKYEGRMALSARVSLNEKYKKIMISIRLDIHIQPENADSTELNIGTIETRTEFLLPDWNNVVKLENDKMIIDEATDAFLVGVAYDSTRGLLKERGKNDLMGSVIIPLVNPAEIQRSNTIS
jgi:hypothetical protein